jgi:cytochrome P450
VEVLVTQTSQTPAIDFRLDDPAVAKDPGPFYEELRSTCPVGRTDAHGGFWIVSRYADIHEAALNTEAFSNASGVIIPPAPNPPSLCLEQDEPQHRIYRKPMQTWFSSGRMAKLEASIRSIVTGLIDAVIEDGRCNIGAVLAEPVPPVVIASMLGLPETDWQWFGERNHQFLRLVSEGDYAGSQATAGELVVYLTGKLEERRSAPQNDMLSDIVAIEVDGEPISTEGAVSLAYLILAAGHETTVGAIGGMLYRLASSAATRDRLLADPSLVPSAVEEALRLESPLPGLGRMLLKDTTLAGVDMPEAERVMLLYGAANRDASVFEDADQFKVDRANNRHLAFGVGIHRCVGAPLARMELRVVLEEVLRRMPGIRLDPEHDVVVDYHFSRSFDALPVVW